MGAPGCVSANQGEVGGDEGPLTLTRNLLANPDEADRLADLFRDLYVALDERNISYLQGSVQIILDSATGEELRQRLADLGVQATIKDP